MNWEAIGVVGRMVNGIQFGHAECADQTTLRP